MAAGAKSGRDDQGFALVEALASLVVVAMIGLLILEGVGAGRRVWERADTRAANQEVIASVEEGLRDRLQQTFPATIFLANPQVVDFQGASDRVAFVSNPATSQRPSPLRRYSLAVDTAGELVLDSISDVQPKLAASPSHEVLLTGVRALGVDYFGVGPPDFSPRWRPSWTAQQLLPQAIRIRVVFAPGDSRVWPDLIVRPRATIDSGCVISTDTHRCQGRAA